MTKTERYDGLMTSDAKAILLHALEFTGTSMNDFMVSAAVEKAEKVIEEKTTWKLNREQSLRVAEALLGEREPNEAMKEAVRDYQQSELGRA